MEEAIPSADRRADFGSTLALTVTLALAAFAVVMAAVMLVVEPKPIVPSGELGEARQGAETALFLVAFLAVLPLALAAVPRLSDAIAAGPNGASLPAICGLLAAGLAAAVLLVRLGHLTSWGDGMGPLLVAAGCWWGAAIALLVRARSPRPAPALRRLAGAAPAIWGAAGALLLGTLLAVTHLGTISPLALVLAVIAAAALLAFRRRLAAPRLPPRWGLAVDVALAGLLALAVPDLVIFRPEEAASSMQAAYETGIIQLHQDFLLGPANQVLGGSAMLVDTASQYGVGSIYLLAGWFELAPIGYGTLGFLDGSLTALYFVAGYCLLRVAGASRPLAATALALGLVILVLNLVYPVGALPQQGPLRFGLPMPLILFTVAGARWPRRSTLARAAALAVLALSSIWSLEAFAGTAITFAALAAAQAIMLPPAGRLRWLGRQAALAATACVAAHLLFAAATLAASGELPDWGQYLAYLDEFVFGHLGDLTYDFSRWSPGLAVGAGYLASSAAVVLLLLREPGFARREWPAMLATAGLTAYGVVLFSYFVNRSADHILPYVSLPALLCGALWVSFLLRSRPAGARSAPGGGIAFAAATAVLLFAVGWSSIGPRFPDSALAHALPRGEGLRDAIHRLWHPPPLNPLAPTGEQLLARYMPGERHSVVLVTADLATEVLIRSGRANTLPLGDVREDSFVPEERIPGLRRAIDGLEPGDRLLTDRDTLRALAVLRAHPRLDPLAWSHAPPTVSPLQRWALERIDARFRLRTLVPDRLGFVVLQLGRRR